MVAIAHRVPRILHIGNRSVTGACVARDDVSAPDEKTGSSSSSSKPAVVVRTRSGVSATLQTAPAADKQKRPPHPSRGLEALQGPQVQHIQHCNFLTAAVLNNTASTEVVLALSYSIFLCTCNAV
jgi:hypothetical protein